MPVRKLLLTTALIAAPLVAAPWDAHANITFNPNPGPALPGAEENVIFEAPDLVPGTTQIGDTNKTDTNVTFDTVFAKGAGSHGGAGTGQFIAADGIGHANLQCVAGGTACVNLGTGGLNGHLINSLEMKPTDPTTGWGDALLNLDFGTGTANIFVKDNLGNNFSFTLSNGQNKFSLLASDGEAITDIQITQLTGSAGPFGFNLLKQPDISGVCTIGTTGCEPIPFSTPEPTSIAILGVGLLGLGFLTRNRRNTHA
jgi:PEP-CTERM motif-containing protein